MPYDVFDTCLLSEAHSYLAAAQEHIEKVLSFRRENHVNQNSEDVKALTEILKNFKSLDEEISQEERKGSYT